MYEWIEKTFNMGAGFTQAIAVVLALAVVLLLFGLFIFILKRLTGGGTPQSRNRQPRVAVMDSAAVDARRRLLLIRRDNVEHLILIGGPTDVVVEQHIVRNAPLAAPGRTAGYPATTATVAPAIKTPTAPGPDIPPTPDDLMPDDEPVTALASAPVSARAPAPAQDPAPADAASPEPSPVLPRKSELLAGEPVRPAATPEATPLRATRPPVSPASTPSDQRPVMSHSNSRAEDLLRAATQNGFNRTGTRVSRPETTGQTPGAAPAVAAPRVSPQPVAQAPVQPSGQISAPSRQPAETLRAAPEVRAEPLVSPSAPDTTPSQAEAAAAPATRTTPSPGSLARPFSPRDRPNYGSHSITPPASGPAARAKTALLKPVETNEATARFESVVAGGETIPLNPAGSAPSVSAETGNEPEAETGAAVNAGSPAGLDLQSARPSEVDASDDQGTPLTREIETVGATAALQGAGEPAAETEASDTGSRDIPAQVGTPGEDETAEEEATQAEASDTDIALDLEDLLEDETEGNVSSDAGTPEEERETSSRDDEANDTGSEDAPETPEAPKAPAVTAEPASTSSRAPEVRAEPRPSGTASQASSAQGLGDRNPIEEEMAKILDEIGGQQKR